MQQHVFHDGIGALAVLDHLFEVVLQKSRQFVDFLAHLFLERGGPEHVIEFIGQFGRKCGEIIDEIERVLDLVRDPGGELAERSEFFRLHQAILRGAKVVERGGELPGSLLHLVEQADIADRDHGLVGEGLQQLDMVGRECPRLPAGNADDADRGSIAQQRDEKQAADAAQPHNFP